ncbi:hypothetical protein B4U80_04388 [Leptotrombidium deliense]|uniref:GATOR complex protein NPRL3 n=1 Tax=Leptotrombidium deliense TaxID=299467 RepID=A0A443SAE5_9ACAR|nr:hypothetical protein B4U80_04388 [Leptotrombidium deliense]
MLQNRVDSRKSVAALDEASPLAVFLVKSGSNGDRLLFRYPYKGEELKRDSSFDKCSKKKRRKNPYTLCLLTEDTSNASNTSNVNKQYPAFTELFPINASAKDQLLSHSNDPHLDTVVNISDNVLSNLFAVKSELCGEKFELKINDVRFVGHPVLVSVKPNFENECFESIETERTKKNNKDNDLFSFNIVFALKANASHDIVNCYHDCSKRVAIALLFEERRVGYLTAETRLMLSLHDEVSAMPEDSEESPYRLILEKSPLATDLRRMYDSLKNNGLVYLRINRWIEVSFCVPQKIHRLTLSFCDTIPEIGPQEIKKCLESLRPYHGILLLADTKELLSTLPADASPAFKKIICLANPLKNLLELSADSAVALPHVFHVVSQLITWAKVTVIYPLCETNMYIVYPLAPTAIESTIVAKFREEFKGADLSQLMSRFSFGVSLSQLKTEVKSEEKQKQLVRQIVWMLKHRLLLQLHTYVYLVPLSVNTPYLTKKIQNGEKLSNDISLSEVEHVDFDTGTNSLATSPTNVSNGFAARTLSKSDSEEELSSPKDNGSFVEETATIMLSDVGLNSAEQESILKVPAAKNLEDLRLFTRLCPYFNGKHHLEDIMYYENIRRGNLLSLIEKFKDVLLTCMYEDTAVSQLCPYNYK